MAKRFTLLMLAGGTLTVLPPTPLAYDRYPRQHGLFGSAFRMWKINRPMTQENIKAAMLWAVHNAGA